MTYQSTQQIMSPAIPLRLLKIIQEESWSPGVKAAAQKHLWELEILAQAERDIDTSVSSGVCAAFRQHFLLLTPEEWEQIIRLSVSPANMLASTHEKVKQNV